MASRCAEEGLGTISFPKCSQHWHRLPRIVGVSPSLGVFKNCKDVALNGHGGDGQGLDLVLLEVFSILNDSMVL